MDADGTAACEQTERRGGRYGTPDSTRSCGAYDSMLVPDAPDAEDRLQRSLPAFWKTPGGTVSAASRVPPPGCPQADCLNRGKILSWQRVTLSSSNGPRKGAIASPASDEPDTHALRIAWPEKIRPHARRRGLACGAQLTSLTLPGLPRHCGLQRLAAQGVDSITVLTYPGPE